MPDTLKSLIVGLAAHRQPAPEPDDSELRAWRDRLTPLENRVAALLKEIPPEIQCEGVSLPSLQIMLRGRWRGHPPAGAIGTALRKLGYRRERKWRGGDIGFQALWYPPTN